MRDSQAAHAENGRGRLAWVVLGAAFLTLLVLASPSPAQAGVCPAGGPGPAPPNQSCRPVCVATVSVPAARLTATVNGDGTLSASAYNTYWDTAGPYDNRGDGECAEPNGTNVWDVKRICGFHCVHWHTQIPVTGVPVPATTLITPMDGSDFFIGWSDNCTPSATTTVPRNRCSILMNGDKTIDATFDSSPDAIVPTTPVLSVSAVGSYDVTLNWTASFDEWLGGYEIYRDAGGGPILYSRVGPLKTSVKLINQFCQADYTYEVRAFDSANDAASNTVDVHTGRCIPATRPNTILHVWPQKVTKSRTAYFHWGANRAKVRYQCKLDKKLWKKCFPGKTYRHLRVGKHVFRVRAYDAAGKDKTPATYRWTIRR